MIYIDHKSSKYVVFILLIFYLLLIIVKIIKGEFMRLNKLILIFPLLFLFSCNNELNSSTPITDFHYGETILNDLNILKQGPYKTKDDISDKYNLDFEETKSQNGEYFIYTVILSYKETYIANLSIIVCPSSYISEPHSYNLPHIGYNEPFNLASAKNPSKNEAKGCRLQMALEEKQTNFYALVSYENNYDLYKF